MIQINLLQHLLEVTALKTAKRIVCCTSNLFVTFVTLAKNLSVTNVQLWAHITHNFTESVPLATLSNIDSTA
jgi:hypothetical protein